MLSANKERLLIAFISSSLLLLFLTLLYNLQHKVERNCDSRHFVLFLIFGIHSFLFKSYATIYSFVCFFVCFFVNVLYDVEKVLCALRTQNFHENRYWTL